MTSIYKTRRMHEWLIIERIIYPRIRLFVNCKDTNPEIKKIVVLEKCKPSSVAHTVNEINFYLNHFSHKWIYN
jgi:hypothetical protein